MRIMYRDAVATVLTVIGAIVMFAKVQSYNWWLIGSWKGALGVLAFLGLGILLTNVWEIFMVADGAAMAEVSLWVIAATVIIPSLFTATTRLEFVWSGTLIGLAWLAQTARHIWHSTHHPGHHYIPAR